MAISKKVTFEGNTYNLGNKDRVAAYTALRQAPVILSGNYNSASFQSFESQQIATAGSTASIFVADRGYTVQSARFNHFITSSAVASYMNLSIDANGSAPGSGDRVLSDNSSKGVRNSGNQFTVSTGSLGNTTIDADEHLSLLGVEGTAEEFYGVGSYTVVLTPTNNEDKYNG